MNYGTLFETWGLKSLKLNIKFLEMEFVAMPEDREAAWEMYVELITRIITQRLGPIDGDEKTALDSVYSLFDTTRDILKRKGRKAQSFTKISVIILNQIIRPFTSKWHKLSLSGAFNDTRQCELFRAELKVLQDNLRKYSAMLANLADVEDITDLNDFDKELE